MHAPQRWFTIPALARPRLGARPRIAASVPRPILGLPRLPRLSTSALAGLAACLLVLVHGLLAAELLVWTYQIRLTDDARSHATAGLDSAASLVETERTRAINNADLAGGRLGLIVAQGGPADDLVKSTAELRTTLRTSLVAVLDSSGRTLASDPASNLPFGTTWEARQALAGKSVVVN